MCLARSVSVTSGNGDTDEVANKLHQPEITLGDRTRKIEHLFLFAWSFSQLRV